MTRFIGLDPGKIPSTSKYRTADSFVVDAGIQTPKEYTETKQGKRSQSYIDYARQIPTGEFGQSLDNPRSTRQGTKGNRTGDASVSGDSSLYPTQDYNLNGVRRKGERPGFRDEFGISNIGPAWTAKADKLAADSLVGNIDVRAAADQLTKELANAAGVSYSEALQALMACSPDLFARYRGVNVESPSGQLGGTGTGLPRNNQDSRHSLSEAPEASKRMFAEDPSKYEEYRRGAYSGASNVGGLTNAALESKLSKAGLKLGSKKLLKFAEKIRRSPDLQAQFHHGSIDAQFVERTTGKKLGKK